MADGLTNHRSIFLFNETLVILEIGTPPCEGETFLLTGGEQRRIDEFASVVRIHAQDRKRKEGTGRLERREDFLSMPGAKGKAFGPSSGNISEGECREKASCIVRTTMRDQIHL